MYKLKLLAQSVVGLIKRVWLFPRSIGAAVKQRRRHAILAAVEAERLDRIRNPSDYLGK